MKRLHEKVHQNARINFERELYAQYVKYNGKSDLYYGTGKASDLKFDKIYRVINADISSDHTELTIQEVDTGVIMNGTFNSCWFTPLKGYLAIAKNKPKIGERAELLRITNIGNQAISEDIETSNVVSIEIIAQNTYALITQNSVYIVI